MTIVWMFNIKFVRKVTKDSCFTSFSLKDMVSGLSPLLFRKLSNPDIFSPTGKAKLQRQLSQDDCKLRRGSLASSLSGKYRTFFFLNGMWEMDTMCLACIQPGFNLQNQSGGMGIIVGLCR